MYGSEHPNFDALRTLGTGGIEPLATTSQQSIRFTAGGEEQLPVGKGGIRTHSAKAPGLQPGSTLQRRRFPKNRS